MFDGVKRWRLLGLLAACLAGMAAPALAADTNPRIVLQSNSEVERAVEVAAWTPDGKYVLTANGFHRHLVIWEAATGRIVDRAAFPSDAGSWAGGMLWLDSIAVAPDGRSVIVHALGVDVQKGDFAVVRDYRVDLVTRAVTALPPGKAIGTSGGVAGWVARQAALAAVYEARTDMTPAAAEQLLPRLPRSPDGRQGLRRNPAGGVAITGVNPRVLLNDLALGFDDAALSPDGHMLVMVEGTKDDEGSSKASTNILRYDVTAGRFLGKLNFPGTYGAIRWLDNARLLVSNDAGSQDRDSDDAEDAALPAPSLVVDAASGAVASRLPGRRYIAPIATGFIAADLGACRHGMKGGATILLSDGATWRPLKLADHAGSLINGIYASPDGKLAALILVTGVNRNVLLVIDTATGKSIDELGFPKEQAVALIMGAAFTPDGSQLIVAANGGAVAWRYGQGRPRELALTTSVPQMIATDGASVLMSGILDGRILRADLVTGAALPPVELPNAIAGGFLPGKPLFWSASAASGIRLWDTRDWKPVMTLYPIDGGNFVAVTPDGRYDTNLGPDASQFRWIVPDAPFQSLGAQTFMRDYFTPRLAEKVLDCTTAGACATILPALPSLTTLNRVLPEVRITTVVPDKAGAAVVYVTVNEGVDPVAANGRTHSGVYNIQLFRNGRLVDNVPDSRDEGLHQTLDEWRKANRSDYVQDASGHSGMQFEIPLPTGSGAEKQVFTAYAFNEDRVKSETARYAYAAPPAPPRPRRAYIVTIGIDAYDDPRLKLNFSAADAKLIGKRLGAIPGYEVHHFDLTSATLPDGSVRRVTSEVISAAFLQLWGAGDGIEGWGELLKGFDTTGITQVTPDDLVIVTWSGHGWANRQGDFFLVPADAKWPAGAEPDQSSLISAADLTNFLRPIHAGEIALIIDACHSGASVDSATFKPGPMGDPGLGQLAYDKGMRILAATQASDVAIEDASVGQGLLTYALAGEGVTADGGNADLNHDGRITLDEWLRYAVQRLPSLSADVKLGKVAAARGFDRGPDAPVAKAQEPALFDFTGQPSPVILRTGVKMIRAWFALALLLPAPAEAAIRALFVGVNQYRFSRPHNPNGQFEDLKGTVNDVMHIKDALREAYGLDLDRPKTGCVSRNAVSTTLTDDCATRAALIGELDARIVQSAPGDTLLFYYAGHGATVRDDVVHDQASGYDTTLLTTDAREPGADSSAEILDRDIGAIIDRATGRGVNVVTIFDSCYSESGTRDFGNNRPEGRARDAPKLVGMPAQSLPPGALPPAGSARVQGYRVHLAAALENQKARETGAGAAVSGVFTTQLAATLLDMRGATFDDIITETRRKVEEVGQGTQSPRGSGALTARLGGAVSHLTLLDAKTNNGGVTILAGRLSGVTVGSRFAVHKGSSEASSDVAPLATGSVTSVEPATATLVLDPGAAALTKRLVVRESQHAFGTRALAIRNLAPPADRAFVSKAIVDGRVATEAEPAQLMVKQANRSPTLSLVTVGGQALADLGLAADPRFAAILAQETAKVARVNDLIGLRTAPDSAQLGFCISNDMDYDLMSCPPLAAGKRRQIFMGQNARLTVRNLTDRKRYVYVFGIDERFGVSLILPEGAQSDPIDVSRPLTTRLPLKPTSTGPYRFVTVATDQPIDASAFQQSATGSRGVKQCASALQRALCAVMQGTRDPEAPKVGDWTAIVSDVDVIRGAAE